MDTLEYRFRRAPLPPPLEHLVKRGRQSGPNLLWYVLLIVSILLIVFTIFAGMLIATGRSYSATLHGLTCYPVPKDYVEFRVEGYVVKLEGRVVLIPHEFVTASPDERYWWCNAGPYRAFHVPSIKT